MKKNKGKEKADGHAESKAEINIFSPLLINIVELEKSETRNSVSK